MRKQAMIVALAAALLISGAAFAQVAGEQGNIGQYLAGKVSGGNSNSPIVYNPLDIPQLACHIVWESDGTADSGAYDNGMCRCVVLRPGATDEDEIAGPSADDYRTLGEVISVPTRDFVGGRAGKFDRTGNSPLGVLVTARKNEPYRALRPSIFNIPRRAAADEVGCLCDELDRLGLDSGLLSQAGVDCS